MRVLAVVVRRPFAVPFAVWLGAALAASGGCAEDRVGLGEACIKGSDCLSGVCAAQLCAGEGTLFTDAASLPPVATASASSSADASGPTSTDAAGAGDDAASDVDAGAEAGGD